MPITVFDVKGVPGSRRERIEAAVVVGGRNATGPHDKGGFRVLITGPHGFECTVTFAIDDDPAVIAEREAMEEQGGRFCFATTTGRGTPYGSLN